ncbi:hypothetical protein HDV06_006790 [Boothiomyces sp. JEL0866]|nr:hypothetical protein HDV06_006790 [Boothiomyces sp. JEL0866]
MREFIAYTIPSCLFVGFAIHDLFSSLILLLTKFKTAGNTILWKIAFLTWFFIFALIAVQVMVLDFFASPYVATNMYVGIIIGLNYFMNWLVTLGITFMLVVRIKLFYGKTSTIFKMMTIYGVVVVLLKLAGNILGMYVCYRVANGQYLIPNFDPLYPSVALALAFGLSFEGVFSAIGTVSFLYFLTGFQGFKNEIISDKKFQYEAARLTVIFGLSVLVSILGIWLAINDNWIDHSAYFIPSCIYSLELLAFLDLSYNNAKDMLVSSKDKSSSKNNSRTGVESRQKSSNQKEPQYDRQFKSMTSSQYSANQSQYPASQYSNQQDFKLTAMPPKPTQRQKTHEYDPTKVVNYF